MGFSVTIIYLLISVITTVLGVLVYLKNHRNIINQVFALFTFCLMVWIVTLYSFYQTTNPDFVIIFGRLNFAASTFFMYFIFLFIYFFPRNNVTVHKISLYFYTAFTASLSVITAITPLVDSDELIDGTSRVTVFGPLYPVFIIHFIIMAVLSMVIMVHKYQEAKGYEKNQIRYLFFGIFISLFIGSITNIFIPLYYKQFDLQIFGPFSTLIFVSAVSYVILKQRFLDIRMVLGRTVAYFIFLVVLAGLYAFSLFIIAGKLLGITTISKELPISTLLALFMAFTFQPLRRYLEKRSVNLFYQEGYDSSALLQRLSHLMAQVVDLSKLGEMILAELEKSIKISAGSIVLIDGLKTSLIKKVGSDHNLLPQELLISVVKDADQSTENILIFDELNESKSKTIMRQYGWSIVLPLSVKGKLIGALLLADKSTGSIYTQDDIKVFKILAPEIAVAIQNSQHFEEIKSFSSKLKLEVKKATFKLKQANSKLKELDQLKDEFVSVASHELRTPMTAIKSYIWMTLDGQGGRVTSKQKFYLQRSYESTDRLIKLVNNMLNISRIDSGRLSLELNQVDLVKLSHEVIDEVSPRAKELGIDLILQPYPNLPAVIADADKIKEVVINLVGNSLKFTPKKGQITISFQQVSDKVITSVTDTGAGLSPDVIKNLFQKFGFVKGSYQINQTSTSQGTGLGLYICKQILELHHGKIEATSEGIRRGSTFSFYLPAFTPSRLKLFKKQFQHASDVGIIHNKI